MVLARTLDVRGKRHPIAHTKIALRRLRHGDLLEVVTTDQNAIRDFSVWARSTGEDLIETSQLGAVFRFVVRKR